MAVQYRAEEISAARRGMIHPIPWRRRCHSAGWMLRETARLGCYVEGMETWKSGAVADEISRRKASARVDKMISKRLESE